MTTKKPDWAMLHYCVILSESSRICPNFNCNYTYRERALASLSTPKLCAVRCEPLTLLNRHFSDSDGGADGTVGKLCVMRVWWCCKSDFTGFK